MNRMLLAALALLCLAALPAGAGAQQAGPGIDEQIDLALGALDDAPPPTGGPQGAPKIVFGDFDGYPKQGQPFDLQPVFAQDDISTGTPAPRR